jgi:hypothetical protein
MKLEFLTISIRLSALIAALPVIIMLINRKTLFKYSYGFALFGIYTSHFLSGVFEFVCANLFNNAFPVYHFYNIILSIFLFLLFSTKIITPILKNCAKVLLFIMLLAEFYDFFFRGGLFSNNNFAYPILQFSIILFYFLYLLERFKFHSIEAAHTTSEFAIFSTIFVYAVVQFLFALIENDIRYDLKTSVLSNILWLFFIWTYIIYLLVSSYFLHKDKSISNS